MAMRPAVSGEAMLQNMARSLDMSLLLPLLSSVHSKNGMSKIAATAVAGRKIIVRTAIDFIAELSLIAASAMSIELFASSLMTRDSLTAM